MSFLENPFAEEDEALSNTPLQDFDVLQRENRYNDLILAESTLEKRRREIEDEHLMELRRLVQINTNLRRQLDFNETQSSCVEFLLPSVPNVNHSFIREASNAFADITQQRIQDSKLAMLRISDSVEFFTIPLLNNFSHLSVRERGGLPDIVNEDASKSQKEEDEATVHLPLAAMMIRQWLQVLEEENANAGEIDAEDLIHGFVVYIQNELQRYTELHSNVLFQRESIREKRFLLKRLERENALSSFQVDVQTFHRLASFSCEYGWALLANSDLSEQIRCLEPAVALLLKDEPTRQKALAYSEVVRRCRSQQRQLQLHDENVAIGREIIFLRQGLLPRDSTQNAVHLVKVEHTHSPCTEPTVDSKMKDFNTKLISKIFEVEVMLKQDSVTEFKDSYNPLEAEMEVKVKVLSALIHLQNSCLRVLTALNADLEIRALKASLLTQLVLHNSNFENRMVESVLDVSSYDLDSFPSEVGTYLKGSNEEFFSKLWDDLGRVVSVVKLQYARQAMLTKKVCYSLSQDLLPGVEQGHSYEDLAASSANSTEPVTPVLLEEDIERFMKLELTLAKDSEVDLTKDISSVFEEWRMDSEKKLRWLNQQSHIESLRQLCVLEKQNDVLEQRLRNDETALQHEQTVKSDPALLECEIQAIELEIAVLEAEEQSLIEQIFTLQGVRRA